MKDIIINILFPPSERDAILTARTKCQWLKILTTSGLIGYILCHYGEELVVL